MSRSSGRASGDTSGGSSDTGGGPGGGSVTAALSHARDSSELLWDDIDRPKFYSLLTCASASIRLMLYPAALVKTRLQASGSAAAPAAAATVAAAAQATAAATSTVKAAAATSASASSSSSSASSAVASSASRLARGMSPAAAVPVVSAASAPPLSLLRTAAAAATGASVPHYRGTGDAFATILRTEGKLALYRGFRVNLLGLAVDPLVVGSIEYTRTWLTGFSKLHSARGDGAHDDRCFFRCIMAPQTAITLLSAGGSACIGQVIQVPVDVVTQKKQMQMHALHSEQGGTHNTHGTSVNTPHASRRVVRWHAARLLAHSPSCVFSLRVCV